MADLPARTQHATPEASRSYEEFLADIKTRIRSAQVRAARAINGELIAAYWHIGREIERRQTEAGPERGRRGAGVIQRLSADLRAAFSGVRGFSPANLARMRSFAKAWPAEGDLARGVRDLPWGHIVVLLQQLDDSATREWYVRRAGDWSRAQLEAGIASQLHQRQGSGLTNFDSTLERDHTQTVQRITRDPVVLDFVHLTEASKERDLEEALLSDIQSFMLAVRRARELASDTATG